MAARPPSHIRSAAECSRRHIAGARSAQNHAGELCAGPSSLVHQARSCRSSRAIAARRQKFPRACAGTESRSLLLSWHTKREGAGGKHCGEGIAGQKFVLPLADPGDRIKPLQLGIDKTGMAHNHAVIRQPLQKTRKERAEISVLGKVIGAGKGWIGAQAKSYRPAAESTTEQIEEKPLRVGEPPPQRLYPPALA